MPQPYFLLHRLLRLLLLSAAAVLFCRFLFRPLLPLLLAFALSALLCRPVDALCQKLPLPRGLCALLLALLLTLLFGVAGWLLWRLAVQPLGNLMEQLPQMADRLQQALAQLQTALETRFSSGGQLPPLLSPARWLKGIQPPALDIKDLTGSLGWAASSLPDLLLTGLFIVTSTVLLTGQRQEILSFVRRQLPPKAVEILSRLRRDVGGMLLGWCKAQGILSAVTFVLLAAGLFLLRVQNALLLALVIALLDTLPILGAGLFLLPWALVELLLGSTGRAAGLALLYAAAVAVRNLLEPHVLGRQIGLHPFVSLVSVYYGWRLAGFAGMLLAPCGVLILVKLQEWGYSKLWR